MLTQTLSGLERNGLVWWIDHQTKLPFVESALAPLGASFRDVLLSVDQWIEKDHEHFDAPRQTDDRLLGLR
jgi:DNA-binding HxlR family transcriptional regulator